MVDCRKRLVDAVVVYRYDRFARSLRQLVNALEEFRSLGIDFISLHEGVDTSTPNGRLVFGIFASIAEFERELIRDRVRSGLSSARSKGERLGRPRSHVDVAKIAALRTSGASWRTISNEMGLAVGTLHKARSSRIGRRYFLGVPFCEKAARLDWRDCLALGFSFFSAPGCKQQRGALPCSGRIT